MAASPASSRFPLPAKAHVADWATYMPANERTRDEIEEWRHSVIVTGDRAAAVHDTAPLAPLAARPELELWRNASVAATQRFTRDRREGGTSAADTCWGRWRASRWTSSPWSGIETAFCDNYGIVAWRYENVMTQGRASRAYPQASQAAICAVKPAPQTQLPSVMAGTHLF